MEHAGQAAYEAIIGQTGNQGAPQAEAITSTPLSKKRLADESGEEGTTPPASVKLKLCWGVGLGRAAEPTNVTTRSSLPTTSWIWRNSASGKQLLGLDGDDTGPSGGGAEEAVSQVEQNACLTTANKLGDPITAQTGGPGQVADDADLVIQDADGSLAPRGATNDSPVPSIEGEPYLVEELQMDADPLYLEMELLCHQMLSDPIEECLDPDLVIQGTDSGSCEIPALGADDSGSLESPALVAVLSPDPSSMDVANDSGSLEIPAVVAELSPDPPNAMDVANNCASSLEIPAVVAELSPDPTAKAVANDSAGSLEIPAVVAELSPGPNAKAAANPGGAEEGSEEEPQVSSPLTIFQSVNCNSFEDQLAAYPWSADEAANLPQLACTLSDKIVTWLRPVLIQWLQQDATTADGEHQVHTARPLRDLLRMQPVTMTNLQALLANQEAVDDFPSTSPKLSCGLWHLACRVEVRGMLSDSVTVSLRKFATHPNRAPPPMLASWTFQLFRCNPPWAPIAVMFAIRGLMKLVWQPDFCVQPELIQSTATNLKKQLKAMFQVEVGQTIGSGSD